MRPETRLEALTSQIGATAWALGEYLVALARATRCKALGHDWWKAYLSSSSDMYTLRCARCGAKGEAQ